MYLVTARKKRRNLDKTKDKENKIRTPNAKAFASKSQNHFDVTTSYKLVCRVTLQETALRSAHVMRSQ